jgi:two-component system phosphate regulon response regulator PhoB
MMSERVLLVEDDASIATLVDYNLTRAGYAVSAVSTLQAARETLASDPFVLVVLDWMLPDGDGIDLLRHIRGSGSTAGLPVLMLTARGEEADRVRGLATGADDYVVKPFSPAELVARVKALLRRAAPAQAEDRLTVADVEMDRIGHRVTRSGRDIDLGPTEYRLLEALMTSDGRVLTRDQLRSRVWGSAVDVDERTVDVHIGRLRKAIVRNGESDPIQTVRGSGYQMGAGRD